MTDMMWLIPWVDNVFVLILAVIGFFLRRLIRSHDTVTTQIQTDLKKILHEVRMTNGRVIALEAWKAEHTHARIEQDIRDLRQHEHRE